MAEDELPPDIDEYLEQIDDNIPVDCKGLEELILKIKAQTGLEVDSIKIIVQQLFQEIRNQTLKGNSVIMQSFGKLSISSPETGNKKKVFVKFTPFSNLLRKIK
jgi:nucleoid DNA-binding protein